MLQSFWLKRKFGHLSYNRCVLFLFVLTPEFLLAVYLRDILFLIETQTVTVSKA